MQDSDDVSNVSEGPQSISLDDVVHAYARIKEDVIKTSCTPSHYQKDFGMNLFYKNEFLQQTGSFKERGALNFLQKLALDNQKRGVVSASIGNHALGLCCHAARLKIPTTVVMPESVPLMKQQKCQSLGAKVIIHGRTLLEAKSHARSLAVDKKLTLINGRDDPEMLAGFGTVALEVLKQVPQVEAVLVPVGSGGLVAGVATVVKAMKPKCLVYGIQTEQVPVFYKSLERGEPVTVVAEATMAPNIGVPYVGKNAFHIAQPLVDKMILVSENCIARAILHLVEIERFVVEGAGAAALAAIIGKLVPELKTKTVVCILTGGNIEVSLLSRCLERGLAVEARLVKFKVNIRDNSHANAELMRLLASGGFNVIRQSPDRVWVEGDIHTVEMKLVCEAKDLAHALKLKKMIEQAYPCMSQFETEPLNDRRLCPCVTTKVVKI